MSGQQWNYIVDIEITLTRTDNATPTPEEIELARELHAAAEKVVTEIMADRGQGNRKTTGKTVKIQ